ncbi:hypothetical protein H4R18_001139 [Coemansia javaensis]|uniref:Carboxymuconolactone decarboxylase-like domain-containing protein n=1 Tax=Coemansia javaensis TaxID=2761396 RepID=A0A9W8HMG9_9FUNG|nr:hypothetical protein H4R18_001139 [Coemansia javaensis]
MDRIRQLETAAAAIEPELRLALAATAMAAANAPALIPPLVAHWSAALPPAGAVRAVELAREALVKMLATIGAPRVINAMAALVDAADGPVRAALSTDARRTAREYRYEPTRERGLGLWRGVYSAQADRLQAKIAAWCPDLIEVIQTDLYGRLLSDCRVLDARATELCSICALVPLDVPAQLKSHTMGAARMGASPAEVAAAAAIAEAVCEQAAQIKAIRHALS